MKQISINAAWNEAAAFVKREPRLLFLIAFGLIALPGVIFQAAAPRLQPGQTPEMGSWMLLAIPMFVLSTLGTLTITMMALGRANIPADAFSLALRRCLSVIGAALLFGLIVSLVLLPVIIFLAILVRNQAVLASLTLLIAAGGTAFLWVRLMMMVPIAAAEGLRSRAILKRSWRLTAGHFWKLLGFVLLMAVVFMVLTFAVTAIGGILVLLVAGQPRPGSLGSVLLLLLGGIVSAGFAVYFNVMLAYVYRQLAAEPTKGI